MLSTLKNNLWFGNVESNDLKDEEEGMSLLVNDEEEEEEEDFEMIKLKDKSVFEVEDGEKKSKIETVYRFDGIEATR